MGRLQEMIKNVAKMRSVFFIMINVIFYLSFFLNLKLNGRTNRTIAGTGFSKEELPAVK